MRVETKERREWRCDRDEIETRVDTNVDTREEIISRHTIRNITTSSLSDCHSVISARDTVVEKYSTSKDHLLDVVLFYSRDHFASS